MLYPTLQALDRLGGSGTKDEIDRDVVRIMGLTDEQLAVEFPAEAKQKGSKVVHRLAWARTYLKKLARSTTSSGACGPGNRSFSRGKRGKMTRPASGVLSQDATVTVCA